MSESDEPNNNNKILILIFPILLVIMVGVAYARLPAVQNVVDAKAPWFREKAGHYFLKFVPGANVQTPVADAPAPASYVGPQGFDIAAFSAHPESWPKSIAIKAETQFPAVLNGKVVGVVRAPAGAEVHLMKIENGKLGVEYKGGGAWLAPEATDLSQRVLGNIAAHP